jgi:hypothetical protein
LPFKSVIKSFPANIYMLWKLHRVFISIFKKLKDSTLRALPARLILSNGPTTLLGPLNLSVSPWVSKIRSQA